MFSIIAIKQPARKESKRKIKICNSTEKDGYTIRISTFLREIKTCGRQGGVS